MIFAVRIFLSLLAVLVAGESVAQQTIARFRWTVDRTGAVWVLNGFDWTSGFNEQDTLVRFTCKRGGALEIGLGADVGIGKGNSEGVTMSVKSAAASLRVDGVSRKSANFEMTSGTELVKTITASDPLIDLLKIEGLISMRQEPAGKSFTFPAKGFGAALAKFLKGCGVA